MEAVFRVVDKGKAKDVLERDEVKRSGYVERDGKTLGVGDGTYVYIDAPEEVIKIFEESDAFEVPENAEEIIQKIKEEEEAATSGVGFLGL